MSTTGSADLSNDDIQAVRETVGQLPDDFVTWDEFRTEHLDAYDRIISLFGQQNRPTAVILSNMGLQMQEIQDLDQQLDRIEQAIGSADMLNVLREFRDLNVDHLEQAVTLLRDIADAPSDDLDLTDLPDGLRLRAITEMEVGQEGEALLELGNGSTFTVDVKAEEYVDVFQPVVVSGVGNKVKPEPFALRDVGTPRNTATVQTDSKTESLTNGDTLEIELDATENANSVTVFVDDGSQGFPGSYDIEFRSYQDAVDGYMVGQDESATQGDWSWTYAVPTGRTKAVLTFTGTGPQDVRMSVEAKRM